MRGCTPAESTTSATTAPANMTLMSGSCTPPAAPGGRIGATDSSGEELVLRKTDMNLYIIQTRGRNRPPHRAAQPSRAAWPQMGHE